MTTLAQEGLDPAAVADLVDRALAEDLGGAGIEADADVTSAATIPADLLGTADVRTRSAGVVAGIEVAAMVLERAGAQVIRVRADGDRLAAGDVVLTATGPVRRLLTVERTTLNLICHLSGIATLTAAWVDAVAGTGAEIRDTRKTTPGLRALEKYAVRCGGGVNHRMGLWDAALVKDNHVAAAGGVAAAFSAVRARFPGVAVEVECDTVAQVREAIAAGADLILLDNMSTRELRESVALAHAPAQKAVLLEASGGLNLDVARDVAATGVDYLAVGALTHSAPILDLGMDLREATR
ncbi:MAG: nicotinate-nucleotide pyrophosphorylase [Mycobacterium sp.]|nr:nicotinate-nucleotide pyrophosphorylase [Mycobacterium sp.]